MNYSNNNPKRVAVIGASGYGGIQSIRLLKNHPHFEISYLAGNSTVNRTWNQIFPFLPLTNNPVIKEIDLDKISQSAEFVILSLPNGVSSKITPDLLNKNLRVIDLSADYRYRSLDLWKQVYEKESESSIRKDSDLCEEATYGIPELNSENIKCSNLVACPGCFPTSCLLPLVPFLKQGLIETDGIIIDSKSGTSGGGRSSKEHLLLSEASESISPYGVIGHRHTSEIEQELSIASGVNINIQFTPHLVPMVRGLLSTIYARLRDPGLTAEDCKTVLETVYRNYNTISILPVGIYPQTKWVRYTNKALISVEVDKRNGRLVIMSVIDNLIKGQAGQAIQNLNLMSGFNHDVNLPIDTFYP